MIKITKKQQIILDFIIKYTDDNGNTPKVSEIRKAIIIKHLIYNFENDLEEIKIYLNKKWNHLKKLWIPICKGEQK